MQICNILVAPKESHFTVVKHIIKYLIRTVPYGLLYPRTNDFDLKGYSDAYYASDKDDRKSTSGSCRLMRSSLVSWNSKKQNYVSFSTTELGYISIGLFCA